MFNIDYFTNLDGVITIIGDYFDCEFKAELEKINGSYQVTYNESGSLDDESLLDLFLNWLENFEG